MYKIRSLSIRIDNELLCKFRYVCSYDLRSMNSQILTLIKQCVSEFEKEHGNIVSNSKNNR